MFPMGRLGQSSRTDNGLANSKTNAEYKAEGEKSERAALVSMWDI